jgi:D-alanine-D-alanine ligase
MRPRCEREFGLKVAVLFGGDSMERDVSVASASQVVTALGSRGHDVAAVDLARGMLSVAEARSVLSMGIDRRPPAKRSGIDIRAVLNALDNNAVDLVFLALHGGSGEDGTVQSLLDLAGLPYTGSGRLGSALAWDKDVSKHLFRHAGVRTPDWLLAPADADQVGAELGYPVIVKPPGQGSTVGLTLVDGPARLAAAIDLAASFDHEVMIEQFIPGRELTVGVLDGKALAVGEIIPATGTIFDYEAKYQVGGAEEIFPAEVPESIAAETRELGLRAHAALKLDDYSRADFRLDAEGRLWCLEVNTLPGLSSGSLLPRSARAAGIEFPDLCEQICQAALMRRRVDA